MRKSTFIPALLWLAACGRDPFVTPDRPGEPRFATVPVSDPTTVLIVDGVTVPAQVAVTGTLAGIVVTVDRASVNLSGATVDCSGSGAANPIGVWIQGDRTGVTVTGGGTGIIKNCWIGVLIGQEVIEEFPVFVPTTADPGGSNNMVGGLMLGTNFSAVVLSNSRNNRVTGNSVLHAGEAAIAILGYNPSASAAGGNRIQDNTIDGFGQWGVLVLTDRNAVRNNVVRGWFYNIGVDHDNNFITGNRLGYFGPSCGCSGVRLLPGADGNLVSDNAVLVPEAEAFDAIYFWVELNTFRNVIRGNTATLPIALSARDDSGACVNNLWRDNTFATRDPACIR